MLTLSIAAFPRGSPADCSKRIIFQHTFQLPRKNQSQPKPPKEAEKKKPQESASRANNNRKLTPTKQTKRRNANPSTEASKATARQEYERLRNQRPERKEHHRRIQQKRRENLKVLNQYQGGMCISGRLTTAERTSRHLISPLGPNWVGTDSAV